MDTSSARQLLLETLAGIAFLCVIRWLVYWFDSVPPVAESRHCDFCHGLERAARPCSNCGAWACANHGQGKGGSGRWACCRACYDWIDDDGREIASK